MSHVLRHRFADLTTVKGMSNVFDKMNPNYVGALGVTRAMRAKVEDLDVICDLIDPIAL